MGTPPASFGDFLAPDTPEQRLARLEAHRESAEHQLRVLGPLIAQYAVVDRLITELQHDLDRHEDEAARRWENWQRDQKDAFEKLARSLENQLLQCNNQTATAVAEWKAERKSDAELRASETKDLRNARRTLNITMIGGIFTIIAALIAVIGPAIIG